jgi:dihydroorotase
LFYSNREDVMNINELFDLSPAKMATLPAYIDLLMGVDGHGHLRNDSKSGDGRMEMVLDAYNDAVYQYVVAIGNGNPPVCDIPSALAYRRQINRHQRRAPNLNVLIASLVNDNTDPEMVRRAWDQPRGQEVIHALKVFFYGVSNDAGNSVSNIYNIESLIKSTTVGLIHKKEPIPITFHAERRKDRSGNVLPIKDREFYCVETDICDAVHMNPDGKYLLRHVSDGRTFEWVRLMRRKFDIHVEISPQYCITIDDDIFQSDDGKAMLQCNCICWPRFKDAWSRQQNINMALSGENWVHFGSDFAKHLADMNQLTGVKINSRGEAVGGLDFLPAAAKSVMIDLFLSNKKAHLIDNFMTLNAADFYSVEVSLERFRYYRRDWIIPEYTYGRRGNQRIKSACFLGGHTMHWELGL